MKSAVETVNPTRVRLLVEVPFEELKPSMDSAYKRIAQQVTIPGFRKGKVPPRLIDQRFGRGVVLEEAVNDALPRFYGQAVEQNDVHVIGSPEVDVTEVPDPAQGGELKFTVEVDVRPEFELPAYDDLAVTVDSAAVTDDEVEEQLTNLRDRFASLRGVERPAQDGDFVTIDVTATADGETLDDLTAKGLSYRIGGDELIPGLDEALTGASAGESRSFSASLQQGEYAGRVADVSATVTAVRERDLPELDDEFAMTASEFDTLDELRGDLRGRLERMKRLQQGVDARDKVLEALLARVDVPLPEGVVRAEVEGRQANLNAQLEQAGLTKADYLQSEGQTAETFDAEVAERAREAIKAQFVLDAVARQQEIGVEQEELTDHLVRRALNAGMRPDEFAQQVVEAGQVPLLMSEVVRAKALASVLETATVTDTEGQPIDIEQLNADVEAADEELADELADEESAEDVADGFDDEALTAPEGTDDVAAGASERERELADAVGAADLAGGGSAALGEPVGGHSDAPAGAVLSGEVAAAEADAETPQR